MTIIDTHVHYWDTSRLRYSWIPADSPILGPWYPDAFCEAIRETRVTGHVFVQAGTDPESIVPEAEWVSSMREQNDSLLGIVAGWQLGCGRRLLDALQAIGGVVGVRIGLGSEAHLQQILSDVELLSSAGLTIDLLGRPDHLPQVRAIAESTPDARLVIDHCLKPHIPAAGDTESKLDATWQEAIAPIAECKNVICKFSGLGTEVFSSSDKRDETWSATDLRRTFEAVIETFGSERVIYGGDWPVSLQAGPYSRWFAATDTLVTELAKEDQERFWSGNAIRTYRLEEQSISAR